MTTPTPEEIAKMASASAGTDTVKTITDLRLEQMEAKWEAKFNEILKINEELRAANKELYAVASAATAAEPAKAADPAPPQQVAAAVVGQPTAAEIAAQQKARDDALLAGVMSEMGYKPKETTNATPKVQDGM